MRVKLVTEFNTTTLDVKKTDWVNEPNIYAESRTSAYHITFMTINEKERYLIGDDNIKVAFVKRDKVLFGELKRI